MSFDFSNLFGRKEITRAEFETQLDKIQDLDEATRANAIEVFESFELFVCVFMNVDFPTLERPKRANSGKFKFGHNLRFGELTKNSACFMFIFLCYPS